MAEASIKRLKRDELLSMLLELEQENETLAAENEKLRKQLEDRKVKMSRVGSLAEASVEVSGLLAAAQETATVYIENVRRLCLAYAKRTEQLCADHGVESNSLTDAVRQIFAEGLRS